MMKFLPAAVLPLLLAAAPALADGGFLGVYVEDRGGPVVVGVIPDTPAARAGIQEGDRFLSVDGKETPNQQAFLEVLGSYDPGDRVELVFERKGERMTKRVRLVERPANLEQAGEHGEHAAQEAAEKAAAAAREKAAKSVAAEKAEKAAKAAAEKAEAKDAPVAGLRARGEGRPFLGVQLEDADGGALVAAVIDGTPAARAGLRAGDKITRLGSASVDGSQALSAALQKTSVGESVGLLVERDGEPIELRVKIGTRESEAPAAVAEVRPPTPAAPAAPRAPRAAPAPRPAHAPAAEAGSELDAVRALRKEIGELRKEIAQLRELVQRLERRDR
jgi:S1-C subfamily serine protease